MLELKGPTQILELGAGIGTLTQCLLEKSDAVVTSVEENDWCLDRLRENTEHLRHFEILTAYSMVDSGSKADFLVIDINNGIYSVQNLVENSPNLRVIFIEGHHLAHRLKISKSLFRLRKNQRLSDVREKRGKKGCAYFEISNPRVGFLSGSNVLLSFLRTYLPLLLYKLDVNARTRFGRLFDKLDKVYGFGFLKGLRKFLRRVFPSQF